MIKNENAKQSGFTIIELMISTVIFSLILMICLAGIMQITKMYYRSVTQNKTREVARSIIDEIGESIRFSSQPIIPGLSINGPQINDLSDPDTGYFCVGQKRYTYAIDRQVKSSPDSSLKQKKHALWVDFPNACSGPADLSDPGTNGRDLVSENMRLFALDLNTVDSTNGVYSLRVGVAYGDDDLLSPRPESSPTELTCEGATSGSEFCATVNLKETVQKRL